jgi:2-dehydro-3-deoxygluconokinase
MPEPRFDVTTLGEMLLRLSIPSGKRLEEATQLDVHPAGAEANVVTLLARLGRKAAWIGALPDQPLGKLGLNTLRVAGVDTSGVIWRSECRMGTYYVELGEPPRGTRVIYDRAGSCAAQLQAQDLPWDLLFDTRLLHLTGITPALSPSCYEMTAEAIRQARIRGVPVSFDINYRQKLWSEQIAAETLLPLLHGAELLFCSQRDAVRLFQRTGSMQDIAQGMLELSKARCVVVTFAERGALLWDGNQWRHERAVPMRILDRLGAGDALAAGVIQGWLDGDLSAGLRYGVMLAALALTQSGDMVVTDIKELLSISRHNSAITR